MTARSFEVNTSLNNKEKFRWGIIGTGGIARAFADDLQGVTDSTITAVGSRSAEKGAAFAANYPDCTAHQSYEALVSDPSVDAVYIATPHTSHFSNTLLALNAGKPVLCEKPFSVNADEARIMITTAKEKNLALMEAMWTRFLPHIKKVRELINNGALGEIVTVEADHGQQLLSRKIPRLILPELAGGALLDLGVYPISLAHMVLGPPSTIMAHATFTPEGVDSQTSIIFAYPTGAQAILHANMIASTPCRAVITGTLGRVEIDTTFYRPTTMRWITHDGFITEYPNEYQAGGLREEALEFAEIVRTEKIESAHMRLDESLAVMESMDEIRRIIGLKFPTE